MLTKVSAPIPPAYCLECSIAKIKHPKFCDECGKHTHFKIRHKYDMWICRSYRRTLSP